MDEAGVQAGHDAHLPDRVAGQELDQARQFVTGCGLARQLVQVRNDDRLDPYGRTTLQVQLLLVLPGFLEVLELRKTAYDSYRILLRGRRGSCTLSKSTTLLPRSKARRNLLMFMLNLSLDGL